MTNFPLPRIDKDPELKKLLLPFCRFQVGDIWEDKIVRHIIACIEIGDKNSLKKIINKIIEYKKKKEVKNEKSTKNNNKRK